MVERVLMRILGGKTAWLLIGALALLVSGYVVSTSTTAFFTATVTNGSNVFTTGTLSFTTTPSGATASGSTIETLTTMMAGDTAVGGLDVSNTGTVGTSPASADFTYVFKTGASPSTALDTTAVTSGGLGLLIFRCYSASSSPQPANLTATNIASCTTAPGASNALYVVPVYPSASACGALSGPKDLSGSGNNSLQLQTNTTLLANVTVPNTSGNTIKVNGVTCTGGNVIQSANFGLGGPSLVTGVIDATNGTNAPQSSGVLAGNHDQLGVITYLPTSAGNSLQGLSSTVTFTFIAEQRAGTVK